MTPTETKAIVTLTVLAAFADGDKHERERDEIKRIADGLGQAVCGAGHHCDRNRTAP